MQNILTLVRIIDVLNTACASQPDFFCKFRFTQSMRTQTVDQAAIFRQLLRALVESLLWSFQDECCIGMCMNTVHLLVMLDWGEEKTLRQVIDCSPH